MGLLLLMPVTTGCNRSRGTAERLEPSRENLHRAVVGSEDRFVLATDQRRFRVQVPDDAVLRVGFGVTGAGWESGAQEVQFVLSAESAQGTTALLHRAVAPSPAGESQRWGDAVVSLASLAGQPAVITLESRVPRGAAPAADQILWTNPQLRAGGAIAGRNIILVSIDTLRADHLGCYGYARDTSPSIDQMAAEGVLFRQAIAPSSWTLPSHASLFTALYPPRHGAARSGFKPQGKTFFEVLTGVHSPVAANVPTLPELLWDAGYDTAGFVGGLFVSGPFGFARGFDVYRDVPADHHPPSLHVPFTDNVHLASRWMAQRPAQPFFVFLHTYQVHMPYTPPPPYDLMFDPDYQGPHRGRFSMQNYADLGPDEALDRRGVEHLQALYDGQIRSMDDAIGDLLGFLRTSGLARNTCVIFTSDHGEEFKEHGNLFHGHAKLYEELIRVPLIVWGPACVRGPRIVDEPVSLVDVMPTVLTMAGVPIPAQVDGQSFDRALAGKSLATDRAIYSEVDISSGTLSAVRAEGFKLIFPALSGAPADMLFDLRNDPGEMVNLIDRRPDVAQRLRTAAVAVQQSLRAKDTPNVVPAMPDAATRERLRALGYTN